MKNIMLVLFFLIGYNCFAQKPQENLLLGEIKYSAEDSIVTDLTTNTIHLYGKATFEHDGVNFKADEVVIYKNTNKVIATGLIAVISVPAVKSSVNSTNKILKYTMGDGIVVIE